MKIFFTIVLLQFVCSMTSKLDTIDTAAKQNIFKSIDKDSEFAISVPSAHSGPYESVDQLNFIIENGKYKDGNASALIVKPRNRGVWKVLM